MNINIKPYTVKSPEGMFKQDVIFGYGLSRVEAEALWDYVKNFVKEHYLACRFDNQIIFYAVSADEPAGKPVKDCKLIPVKLTLYSHLDRKIKDKLGIVALREYIAKRLAREAYKQGGLLSQADISDILILDRSTVKRIVARIKKKGDAIPTRGEIKDIGPGLSHKARIVELLLKRYQPTEVALKTKHGIGSITRYFENFIKVAYLYDEGFGPLKIRYLSGISEKVVGEYIELYDRFRKEPFYTDTIEEIKGYIAGKKGGSQ
jgi:DNA-binding CsgD family transcriptional regulator